MSTDFDDFDYKALAYQVYNTANYRYHEYINWKAICKGYVLGMLGSTYNVDLGKLYDEVKKIWHDDIEFKHGKDAADTLCESLEKKSSAEELADEIPDDIYRQRVVTVDAYNTAAR